MVAKRAAIAILVCAAIGLAVAANIASVHRNLAARTDYVSWCDINGDFSCNAVLSSEYATLLGVPVVYWAVLTYLAMAVGAVIVLRSASATRRRQAAGALFLAAVVGTLFSLYLAAVSFFVLRTICIMCSALYVVQLGLLVAAAFLSAAERAPARGRRTDMRKRTQLIAAACAGVMLVLFGAVAWKAVRGEPMLTAEEIKVQDPEFYAWYTKLPTISAPLPGGNSKGRADALVTVIEFSDFECGHCANAYRSLKQVLPRYQKDVRLSFHHFPLDSSCNPAVKHSVHKYACLAAQASECAGAQGRFWEYHDQLFENQSYLDRDSLLRYADAVGLDRAAFLACLDSDVARQAIARDVAEAMRLGVESTPTFYLNGRTITGAPRADRLGYAIQLERAAKQRGEG
jgi:protein-disulfide isomerase